MNYTREDIQKRFDPGTFARGADYARKGMVVSIDPAPDGVEGEVRGSGRVTYSVNVRIASTPRGLIFSGLCSCPMQSDCKHAVALLLAALTPARAPAPAAASRAAVTNPLAEAWLEPARARRGAHPGPAP